MVALETWDKTKTQHRISCLVCGREPNDRAMGVEFDVHGGAVLHCFRRGLAVARGAGCKIPQYIGNSFVRHPEHKQFDTLAPRLASYWIRLGVLSDDGLAYLNARGCPIPPHDADLRFNPMARHPSGYRDMNDFLQGAHHG